MQRAVNPQTGEVLFLVNNEWKKPEQTAVNPKTGERAFLVNNAWEVMPAFKPPEPVGEIQSDTFAQTPEEMITPLPSDDRADLAAEPTIPESMSVGRYASDYGKIFVAPGIQGVAQAPRGLLDAGIAIPRAFATGEAFERGPVIARALDKSVQLIRNLFGTSLSEQQEERLAGKIAVDKAITEAKSLFEIPRLFEYLSEEGGDIADKLRESVSSRTQQQLEGSTPKGNFLEALKTGNFSKLSLGDNPTLEGTAALLVQVLGSIAPVIATAIITKGASAPTAVVGGGMAAGEGASTAREYIKNLSHEQLVKMSPYYANMRNAGIDESEARKFISDRAAEQAALLQGAVGAFGGVFTGKLVTGQLDKYFTANIRNRLGRIVALGGVGAAEEGAQEFLEGIAADLGINKEVVKEIGEESFANLILGSLGGGAVGAGRGAISPPPPPPPPTERIEPTIGPMPPAPPATPPAISPPVTPPGTPPAAEAVQAPPAFRYLVTNTPAYEGIEPLTLEDADFELEVLQSRAEKGRLTPEIFAQNEITKRLDTSTLMTINDGLRSDPVATIQSLRDALRPATEAPSITALADPAVTAPPVTPPITPDEEITPFLEGEIEGEETVAPAAAVQLATQQEPPKTENLVAGLSPQEVPISALKLSQEVPQFKVDADVKGVVEPLGGKFERVGVAPIQVWKRLDGSLEVISGRHRLDLARRSGEKTMPAQIHDEAEGFTADKAAILDAELNIRDGQGKVKDYVGYFKGSGISKKEADTRGLLARPIGKRSFTIATDGTENLIASHRADVIGDEAAYLIALNAPQDPALQAVGIKAIQDGKNTNTAVNLVQAVKTMSAERDTTADMFGFDESAMREAEEMAKLAARKQKEIQQRLSVMTGASKNPELARKEGIDIKDPDAVRQRIDELRSAKASWDTWSSSPELIGQIRRELRGEPEPIETVTPPVDEDTISMFGDEPPRAASDVDQLATEFPNVPRDLFDGVGSFAKVKPYIQAAYNKGNLKQVETILNSLRKADPPIGQVREPTPEEKRLADLERDLFRLTPPATPELRAAPSAQADLFGVAGLESLPDRLQFQKQKRENNQQLSLFGSEVIDPSENNTAGRKARKAAIDEVKALQETDTPMGLSFANEFAQKQRANLVGQKINSASDLAVLSQVYRDPSFETFRLFFTDADGNIISQLGVTSRLPGSSNAIIGNDLNKYLVEVQKAAKDVGASGFWMLHNHPSGNVQSSGADMLLTKTFNKYMPGMNFLGHVIIDTNKYGLILPDGTYTEISKDMNQKDLVDFQLGSYETVFNPIEMAKKVDEDQNAMVLVVMNNSLQVTGITSLPNSDFVGKTPEQIQRRLMKTALRGMGVRLLVASRNREALEAVASSVENGIHIKDNGQYENFNQMFKYRTILTFPLSRPGVVTADSSKLFDFLRKSKVPDPGRSKYLNWTDLRVLEREPVTIRVEEPQDNLFGDDAQTLRALDETLPKAKKKLPPGRSPELAELAERLSRKEITKQEFDDAVNRYRPIPIYEEALKPATEQEVVNALSSDKQPKANAAIPDGTRVGLRLDIPAWNNHKTFVVSIHEGKPRVTSPKPGTAISYRSTAVAKNVTFGIGNQRKSLDIAIGNAKDAMQTMEGEFVDLSPAETYKRAQEAISDPNYVQIGFDPTRHAYFYDRLTTLPVESAGEVIQIGNMILGKNVEFGDKEAFLYNIGDPTARSNKEVDQSVDATRKEIINFYQGIRQRRASLVKKIEKGEVSIDVQRRLQELNELSKEMQLDARIMYEPNLSARAFRNRAEKAYLDDEIGADVLGVIETMLAKYPKLLEGLQLSVKTDKTLGDAAGQFNPIKRLVTLYKDTSGAERPMTIRHELSHAMEQMMPIGAREAVIREWSKAFQAAIKKHKDAKSQEYFQRVLEFLDRPSKARMEAATRVMPSYDFYQYLNPSEYWAINAEKLMAAQLGTPWNRFAKAMQRLLEGMKKILGFNNKYTTHKVFDQIIGGSMKRLDRGSLLDYMIEGDTDIDFLMDVKKVDDLMDKYKRPDTPTDTSGSVKDMFMGSYEKAKQIAADIKESPLAPVSKMASNIDRSITYARNKNIWFGTGLNQADFKRYNGQLRDSHNQVVASIAVDNALHAGHVGVQVAMLGKLKYDTNIGMFTAVKDEKSMKNVIVLKAELVKQLGAQRAANVMNGYFEAKRSRNIINDYLQREANYERAVAQIDLSGTPDPQAIQEAKDELESIEKAAEKVLMDDNEIDEFIALENEYPQLREMMENWQSVNRNLLDNMFFARIISKKRYEKLKSLKDYVPWYRITDDMEDIHMPTAGAIRGLTDVPRERLFRKGVPQMTREILSKDGQQDFNVRMNPDAEVFVDNVKVDPSLYRLRPDRTLRFNDPIRGGQNVKVIQNRPIDNIIDNMLHNVLMTTKNVMRNYAALKVVDAYGTRNDKGKLRVFATEGEDADGVRFNVRSNGRKIVVQIKDPLIAESVLGMENFELPVNGMLGYFANGFRRSITVFPAFQLKQLFMDAPGAAWVSGVKNPYKLWASVFGSFLAALNPNDPITQILRSKGIGGFQSAFRSPQKELELEVGVIKGNLFAQAMKVLDKIGDASDIAQRRAIYIQLMKETKGDETLALSMAQNVIDFLRRGSGVPAQFVTRTVSFAGAYVQAIDVVARTLAGGGLKGMSRKMAIANMTKNAMLLGAVTVLYAWAVGDDEEYQKLDDQTRARGFFIPGSKEVFGESLVLPMSTGASLFFKTIPEIAYNQIMRDGTETKMDETRLRTALSQAATDALLGPNMTPTAVKPFIEIALNRNFFTGTNMIPRGLEDVEAAEQYNATTSELGKVISSLTSIPGTEKRLLAPIESDHLIRSLFGTVGATAMWGTNLLVEDRVDSSMRDNPLYGPFFLPPVPRGREDLFYDLKDRVDKKYNTYTLMLDRDPEKADEYYEKNEELIDMRPYTDTTASVLSELNAVGRLIGTSADLGYTKKERTEDIRALQEEKNDILQEITDLRREAGL